MEGEEGGDKGNVRYQGYDIPGHKPGDPGLRILFETNNRLKKTHVMPNFTGNVIVPYVTTQNITQERNRLITVFAQSTLEFRFMAKLTKCPCLQAI